VEDQLKYKSDSIPKITRHKHSFVFDYPDDPLHPPIIHLQGSPYEIGYAFGTLYAERIKIYMAEFGSPIAAMMGGWEVESRIPPTLDQMELGMKKMYAQAEYRCLGVLEHQEPQFWEEIQGEIDALRDIGSPITKREVLILATIPESFWTMQNCSNFAAWGPATTDGKLIHAVNLDFESFSVIQNHISVFVKKPDDGNAFIGMGHTGILNPFSWMNDRGLSYGEMTCDSSKVAWPQIPHMWHGIKVAREASTLEEAFSILQQTGGTTGWANLISQGKGDNPYAVDIEVAGNDHAIRFAGSSTPNMIWQTNIFQCYPGNQGYRGKNMFEGQMAYFQQAAPSKRNSYIDYSLKWEDVDTFEKWNVKIRCPRYDRYTKLLNEANGQIDVTKAIEIQSDPVLTTERMNGPIPLASVCDHFYGVKRPIISDNLYSIYSLIFQPSEGIMWTAAGARPAQSGPFWRIDFNEHLELMKKYL
jgi:hypothetical protein